MQVWTAHIRWRHAPKTTARALSIPYMVKKDAGSITYRTFCRGYKDLISKLVYLNKVPKNTIVKRDDSSLIIRCKKTVQDLKPCVSRSAEHIFSVVAEAFHAKGAM